MTEQREQYEITRTHGTDIVTTFDDVARIGKAMAASGYFDDAKDAAKAIVKILAGREMGFGPFAAMNGVHIIQGKPSIGSNLMAAAVKNDPRYDYRVTRMDDDAVSVTFYQDGQELGVSTFTMQDAKDTQYYDRKKGGWVPLAGKHNWRNYPRNMLFARAMSNGVRWFCPDVFAGNAVYTPDELTDEAPEPEWDVVDSVAEEVKPEQEKQAEPQPRPQRQAKELLQSEPALESKGSNGWGAYWQMYGTLTSAGKGRDEDAASMECIRGAQAGSAQAWPATGHVRLCRHCGLHHRRHC